MGGDKELLRRGGRGEWGRIQGAERVMGAGGGGRESGREGDKLEHST